MEKDWSFLITERPDRPKKPENLDGDHTPFSWAYVVAWLIEMRANAEQEPGGRRVPVLSVQQVIDHSGIDDPATEHESFRRNQLHSTALNNLSEKKIGLVAVHNYRKSTPPQNVTDAEVKLSGMGFSWILDDHALHFDLSSGPVATCIRVTKDFINYDGGIYCEHKAGRVRPGLRSVHYVLVLGSGTEDGVKYWKIFNPWSDWGESNAAGVRGFGKICVDGSCGFLFMSCLVTSQVDILSNEN